MEDAVATVPRFLKVLIQMLTGDRGVVDRLSKSLSHLTTHFFGVYDGHGGSQFDMIYLSTPKKIAVLDHKKKQTFVIQKDGLPDAVVWNPGEKKAKTIADLGEGEYKYFVAVEAAAIEKPVTLKPGEEWKGRLELSTLR